MKFKLCFVTGSRAEYGLLRPLMEEIKRDEQFDLQIIVTGMHLSTEYGLTFQEIVADGFAIDKKIEILLSSDTPIGVSKAMGLAFISFAEAYAELNPDLLIVLGDRFETFSAVACAQTNRIPVAHLHGGELTEGAIDDSMRHCITKMSHLHFTSAEKYRQRVIQLGENPETVFNVGAIGLDNILNLKLLKKDELERQLGFLFGKKNVLVTFHPVTLDDNTASLQFEALLSVLDENKDIFVIFTKANADNGGRLINQMIDKYAEDRQERCSVHTSLGSLKYLSILQYVDAVVGNSSSGILEAPSFKIGTVNIGDRQKGRIITESVINCEPNKESITDAFIEIYSNDFQKKLLTVQNPYGKGETAQKIHAIIKTHLSHEKIKIKKAFFDLKS